MDSGKRVTLSEQFTSGQLTGNMWAGLSKGDMWGRKLKWWQRTSLETCNYSFLRKFTPKNA